MKEMKNTEKFTVREWEELASLLSDEKVENRELLNRFMNDDTHNTGKQWKELGNMSNDKEIDVDRAWKNVNSMLKENGAKTNAVTARVRFISRTFIRVAAMALVLISLGVTAAYLNNTGTFSKKIILATGNDQKNLGIDLTDGSKIFLNRNSEFSYRENFGKRSRNVKLTGEAFFEISPDVSKPFIIDAGNAKVKVIGTSFNVITMNSESEVEVFVKTGKVLLSDNSGSQSILLDPGFIGKMDSKAAGKSINKDTNYLSWHNGHLVYDNEKLEVVIRDLKRVYNMDIVADDPSILENPWHSPIDDNVSQDTIIRMICLSFNLSYTKDGSVYHLSKK